MRERKKWERASKWNRQKHRNIYAYTTTAHVFNANEWWGHCTFKWECVNIYVETTFFLFFFEILLCCLFFNSGAVLFRDAVFPFPMFYCHYWCCRFTQSGVQCVLLYTYCIVPITTPNKYPCAYVFVYGKINEGATSDNNMVVALFRQMHFLSFQWKHIKSLKSAFAYDAYQSRIEAHTKKKNVDCSGAMLEQWDKCIFKVMH